MEVVAIGILHILSSYYAPPMSDLQELLQLLQCLNAQETRLTKLVGMPHHVDL